MQANQHKLFGFKLMAPDYIHKMIIKELYLRPYQYTMTKFDLQAGGE